MEQKVNEDKERTMQDKAVEPAGKRILVAYGTKRGSTQEIAARIGEVLRRRGARVDVRPAGQVGAVDGYDLVVLGSSVYIGLWRRDVVQLVRRQREALARKPLWIFSSGPTEAGDPMEAIGDWRYPKAAADFFSQHPPVDAVCFGGSIDLRKASYFERNMIRRARVPIGDFRDWAAIEAWADRIPVY